MTKARYTAVLYNLIPFAKRKNEIYLSWQIPKHFSGKICKTLNNGDF